MTETPKYSVTRKQSEIEIRQYSGYIQAEVDMDGTSYMSAIEKGFNVLAGYIFGNNISREKIDMTAPVQIERSEKIAMTTPVTVTGESRYTVAFVMPSAYTLETLPKPKDSRIRLKLIPAHQMGSIRFSGFLQQKNIEREKRRLLQWLDEQGIETEGDYIVAGYNPPWTPWFLRRNEILIKIKPD